MSTKKDQPKAAEVAEKTEGASPPATAWSVEDYKAAMDGYVAAGVEKAMAPIGEHTVVGAHHFRAAMEALIRHLHEDHPENYLP